MQKKTWKLITLLLAASLLVSACSVSTTSTADPESVDSSVFASGDRGDTWKSLAAVPTVNGQKENIAALSVRVLLRRARSRNGLTNMDLLILAT